jgi:hypothetical protein
MRIRTATAADVGAVTELSVQLFAEDSGRRDPHADTGWPARDGLHYFADAVAGEHSRIFLADDGVPHGYLLGRRRSPDPLRPHVVVVELESM